MPERPRLVVRPAARKESLQTRPRARMTDFPVVGHRPEYREGDSINDDCNATCSDTAKEFRPSVAVGRWMVRIGSLARDAVRFIMRFSGKNDDFTEVGTAEVGAVASGSAPNTPAPCASQISEPTLSDVSAIIDTSHPRRYSLHQEKPAQPQNRHFTDNLPHPHPTQYDASKTQHPDPGPYCQHIQYNFYYAAPCVRTSLAHTNPLNGVQYPQFEVSSSVPYNRVSLLTQGGSSRKSFRGKESAVRTSTIAPKRQRETPNTVPCNKEDKNIKQQHLDVPQLSQKNDMQPQQVESSEKQVNVFAKTTDSAAGHRDITANCKQTFGSKNDLQPINTLGSNPPVACSFFKGGASAVPFDDDGFASNAGSDSDPETNRDVVSNKVSTGATCSPFGTSIGVKNPKPAAPSNPFSFGSSGSAGTGTTDKPAAPSNPFSFGSSGSAVTGTTDKPAAPSNPFSFGSSGSAVTGTTDKPAAPSNPFSFGSSGSAVTGTTDKPAAPSNPFSFGSSGSAVTGTTDKPAAPSNPFSFGSSGSAVTGTTDKPAAPSNPFSFGSSGSAVTGTTDKPAAPSNPFSFGSSGSAVTGTTDKPAAPSNPFSFGSSGSAVTGTTDKPAAPSNPFSFGSSGSAGTGTTDKPAAPSNPFSFGSSGSAVSSTHVFGNKVIGSRDEVTSEKHCPPGKRFRAE